ncbi:MAG: macro domain-containing protein [Treponema sp.]|nr:macro domain-containing protein [Treponema sp.]
MPFRIERNDITKVHTEAIVNTANPMPTYGTGTDTAVYEAAGMAQLLAERKKIGIIERGQSAYTPAFKLQNTNGIRYIIHTVGTKWKDGQHGEIEIMRNCYRNSLQIAKDLKCKSLLDVAAKEKVEVMILGAFGCGAFCNPPEIVSDILASLIRNYNFETVEFAVYCRSDTKNFDVFESNFVE